MKIRKKKPVQRDIWKMNPRQIKALREKEGYAPMSKRERKEYDNNFDTTTSRVLG